MRILLLGTTGQVGWELRRALQPLGEVVGLARAQADFDDPESLRACFRCEPDVVVNAVAYTAVDQAEIDVAQAMRINAEAVAVLADEASKRRVLMIHYSTDYVFDGTSSAPYREDALPAPQSAYGRSKLAGEVAVAASGCDHLVVRTSWVFASRGKNFVRTILRLAAERDTLRIVADQFGAPTSARLIADCTARIVDQALRERAQSRFASGVFHLSASGRTSWHGFAARIVDRSREIGRTPLVATAVEAIATHDYPLAAARPANSSLDTARVRARFGLHLPDWTIGLDLCLDELVGR